MLKIMYYNKKIPMDVYITGNEIRRIASINQEYRQ